jgi:hypothetical protein
MHANQQYRRAVYRTDVSPSIKTSWKVGRGVKRQSTRAKPEGCGVETAGIYSKRHAVSLASF